MSTALAEVSAQQLDVVRKVVFPGASPEELALYLHDCKRQGVHPLDKLLHPTKRGGKYVAITSIDLFRARAADTERHAGTDEPVYEMDERGWPISAKVVVHKIVGQVIANFTGTARWAEYCPSSGADSMWKKMPHLMLSKCAEALALRKAFPRELAGVYTAEEMDQSNEEKRIAMPRARGAGSGTQAPEATPSEPPVNQLPAPAAPAAAPAPTAQAKAEPPLKDAAPKPLQPLMPTGPELDGCEVIRGVLKKGSKKTGTNNKGPYTRYSICVENVWVSTFSDTLGEYAASLKGKLVDCWYEINGDFKTAQRIQPVEEAP